MSGVKRPITGKAPSAPDAAHSTAESPSELDAVSTSEVGTKLDLARQFLDMGDPESARHMLDEVLKEGDAGQKQEAQRLIESMP